MASGINDKMNKNRGLVLVNTGTGKGKTTAALGTALRAAGHGKKVLILQFIKGSWKTGELKIMKRLKPEIDMIQLGKGFIDIEDGRLKITRKDRDNAVRSFRLAREKIISGCYDLVILDELINLIAYGMIDTEEVIKLIEDRPVGMDLVLTGRGAPDELINIADTVTDMQEVKHAYSKGIKAKKGIEY
jgi:cob(I)alamin adenosyltransferase